MILDVPSSSAPPPEPVALQVLDKGRPRPGRAEELAALDDPGREVLIDVGCGDARFAHRLARERPQALVIALDAISDQMRPVSIKATRKPNRGGAPNLLLLIADAAALPPPLNGRADRVTVNFPWAGLLRGVVTGENDIPRNLARLLKPQGRLEIWLNLHTFQEAGLRERMALPPLDDHFIADRLPSLFQQAGLTITQARRLADDPLPVRTTWGSRLTRGSRRDSLFIAARQLPPPPLAPVST